MTRPAYVLSGGRSTRMGRDKARVRLDDETTLLEAVVASIGGVFSSWTAVADRRGKYEDLGVRTIADDRPHCGPVGGIRRAAGDAKSDYFFVTSCDRLGLKRRWVDRLGEALGDEPPAVCFVDGGRIEPLFAYYHTALEPRLDAYLEEGDRAVWRFLERLDTRTIEAPADWQRTIPVNTPDQLRRARRWWNDRTGDGE